jgi:hypothetical protein
MKRRAGFFEKTLAFHDRRHMDGCCWGLVPAGRRAEWILPHDRHKEGV